MNKYCKDNITGLYPYDTIYHLNGNYLIWTSKLKFLDPFCPYEYEVVTFQAEWYFKTYYGLNKKQVWNLINGYDKDYIHICARDGCNNPVAFTNRLTRGFQTYCCHSCASKVTASYYTDSNINSKRGKNNAEWSFFMNKGNENDECVLYLAYSKDYPDWYKFGVSQNINSEWKQSQYTYIHTLVKSTRLNVAN